MKFVPFALLLSLYSSLHSAVAQGLLQEHGDRIAYVSFLADGKTLLAGSEDYTVSLWDVTQAQPPKMWQKLSPFKPGPSTKVLSLTSNGALLARAGTAQGSAEVWNVPKRLNIRTIAAHHKPVIGVAVSGDGSTLVTYCQDELKVWRVTTGKLLFGIGAPKLYSFRAAAASSDGKLIAVATSDKIVSLFSSVTGKLVHQFGAISGQLSALAFSPDAGLLAVAGDGDQGSNVHVWKVGDYSVVPDVLGPPQSAHSIAFSADGQLLAVGGVTVRVWDMGAKKVAQDYTDHERAVDSVAFSPDGAYLASGGEDWKVIVWKLADTP
jgi:WD40 repeat protein